MKLLLTGCEPFGESQINPSDQAVVRDALISSLGLETLRGGVRAAITSVGQICKFVPHSTEPK